jgi:CubicO group peptidase (beta-lactamase class C family)
MGGKWIGVAGVAIGLLLVATAVAVLINQQKLRRFHRAATLWTADQETLIERFSNYDQGMPSSPIRRSGPVMPLVRAAAELPYPEHIEVESGAYTLPELFDRWGTVGFMVLRNGFVYDERYFKGHSADKPWMSFSASKAIVGVLVAIAYRDGLIEDLDDPLSKYAPHLLDSAWQNVSFNQALNMTSGVRWDEWDVSWNSDLGRFGRAFAFGTSFDDWLVTLERSEHAPGTYYNYSSADSQALGVGLIGATKQSIASYTEREIWSKIGAEADAYWMTDDTGRELALSGWNAVLRDYARLGLLYLDGES